MISPKFTVVIPTCRRNDLLARCLDGLAPGTQILPAGEYKVIVTDDGPPEANARALVEAHYSGVRWSRGHGGAGGQPQHRRIPRHDAVAGVHRRRLRAAARMAGGFC